MDVFAPVPKLKEPCARGPMSVCSPSRAHSVSQNLVLPTRRRRRNPNPSRWHPGARARQLAHQPTPQSTEVEEDDAEVSYNHAWRWRRTTTAGVGGGRHARREEDGGSGGGGALAGVNSGSGGGGDLTGVDDGSGGGGDLAQGRDGGGVR